MGKIFITKSGDNEDEYVLQFSLLSDVSREYYTEFFKSLNSLERYLNELFRSYKDDVVILKAYAIGHKINVYNGSLEEEIF